MIAVIGAASLGGALFCIKTCDMQNMRLKARRCLNMFSFFPFMIANERYHMPLPGGAFLLKKKETDNEQEEIEAPEVLFD